MTQSSQIQGIAAHHNQLLAKIDEAKALARECGVDAMEAGNTGLYGMYADLGTALDVSSRRAAQIRH
ncbi:hypothetical protein ACTU44_13170 [Thalassospira sp. SM2505]